MKKSVFAFAFFFLFFVKTAAAQSKLSEPSVLRARFAAPSNGNYWTFFVLSDVELENLFISAFGNSWTAMVNYVSEKKDGKETFLYGSRYLFPLMIGKGLVQIQARVKGTGALVMQINETFDLSQDDKNQMVVTSAAHKITTNEPKPTSWISFGDFSLAHGEDHDNDQNRLLFIKFKDGRLPKEVSFCLNGRDRCLTDKTSRTHATEERELLTDEKVLAAKGETHTFPGMYLTVMEAGKPLISVKYDWDEKANIQRVKKTDDHSGRTVFLQDVKDWMNGSDTDRNLNRIADQFDGDVAGAGNTCREYADRACNLIRSWGIPCSTIWYNIPGYLHACVRVYAEGGYHYIEPQLNRNFGMPDGSNRIYAVDGVTVQ